MSEQAYRDAFAEALGFRPGAIRDIDVEVNSAHKVTLHMTDSGADELTQKALAAGRAAGAMKREIDRIKDKLNSTLFDRAAIKATLTAMTEERNAARQDAAAQTGLRLKAEDRLVEAQKDLGDERQRRVNAETVCGSFERDRDQFRDALRDERAAHKQTSLTVMGLKAEVEDFQSLKGTSIYAEVRELRAKNAQLEQTVSAKTNAFQKVYKDFLDLGEVFTRVHAEVRDLRRSASEAGQQAEQFREEIASLTRTIADQDSRLSVLAYTVKEGTEANARLRTENRANEAALAETTKQLTEMTECAETRRQALNGTERELEDVRAELAMHKSGTKQSLYDEIDRLREQVKSLDSYRTRNQVQAETIQKIDGQYQNASRLVELRDARIRVLEGEKQRLSDEIRPLRQAVEDYRREGIHYSEEQIREAFGQMHWRASELPGLIETLKQIALRSVIANPWPVPRWSEWAIREAIADNGYLREFCNTYNPSLFRGVAARVADSTIERLKTTRDERAYQIVTDDGTKKVFHGYVRRYPVPKDDAPLATWNEAIKQKIADGFTLSIRDLMTGEPLSIGLGRSKRKGAGVKYTGKVVISGNYDGSKVKRQGPGTKGRKGQGSGVRGVDTRKVKRGRRKK